MLSIGELTCPACGNTFVSKKHNKKYCSRECCIKFTNEKLLEKYHQNKKQKPQEHKCSSCGYKLSKYNTGTKCAGCESRDRDIKRVNMLKELGFFDYSEE